MFLCLCVGRALEVDDVKAFKHFGGLKLHANGTLACECDDAPEVKDAADHQGWIVFLSIPRDWPHNSHTERDIGLTKEMAGPAFVRA